MGHRVPFATPRLSRGDLGEAWLAPWSPAARRQTSPSSPPGAITDPRDFSLQIGRFEGPAEGR